MAGTRAVAAGVVVVLLDEPGHQGTDEMVEEVVEQTNTVIEALQDDDLDMVLYNDDEDL